MVLEPFFLIQRNLGPSLFTTFEDIFLQCSNLRGWVKQALACPCFRHSWANETKSQERTHWTLTAVTNWTPILLQLNLMLVASSISFRCCCLKRAQGGKSQFPEVPFSTVIHFESLKSLGERTVFLALLVMKTWVQKRPSTLTAADDTHF